MIRPPGQPIDFFFDTYADNARTDLEDPGAIVLTFTGPTGATDTHHWPPGDIARVTGAPKGKFVYTTTKDPGHWSGLWVATGAVATSSAFAFDVADQAPYVNPADVRNALAGTATLAGTAAVLTDDDMFTAIYEAQAEVNGRLSGRGYTVPFVDTPSLVVQVTRDVAAYLATLTYRRGNPIQTGDPVQLRYQRAQALLKDIASGLVPLLIPAGGGSEQSGSANVVVNNPVDGDLWTAADFDIGPAWPGLLR